MNNKNKDLPNSILQQFSFQAAIELVIVKAVVYESEELDNKEKSEDEQPQEKVGSNEIQDKERKIEEEEDINTALDRAIH